MKGPSLGVRSKVLSGPDDAPLLAPVQMVADFREEILAAIPVEAYEPREDQEIVPDIFSREPRNSLLDQRNAEIAALYLARSMHFRSPWWADEALRWLHINDLPTTQAAKTVHGIAVELRLAGKGQRKKTFRNQYWDDHAFFLVAAMREAGISPKEASQQAARWRDEFSGGGFTVKASKIEKDYTAWAAGPLCGKVWCSQLSQQMEGLTAAEKTDLIQRNKLRNEMLPPLPRGLRGTRR